MSAESYQTGSNPRILVVGTSGAGKSRLAGRSWDTFEKNRRACTRLRDGNVYPQLQWLEFRRPAEAQAWLRHIRKLSQ